MMSDKWWRDENWISPNEWGAYWTVKSIIQQQIRHKECIKHLNQHILIRIFTLAKTLPIIVSECVTKFTRLHPRCCQSWSNSINLRFHFDKMSYTWVKWSIEIYPFWGQDQYKMSRGIEWYLLKDLTTSILPAPEVSSARRSNSSTIRRYNTKLPVEKLFRYSILHSPRLIW